MEPQEQAGALLANAAGFIATRTIRIGLDHGLFEVIAEQGPMSHAELANAAGLDELYSMVWCRSAFAAGVLDSFHMGLADGPSEVHKITIARSALKDYEAHEGLWPREHLPERIDQARELVDRVFFQRLLQAHGGKVDEAAEGAGIPRATLYRHLRKLGLVGRKKG